MSSTDPNPPPHHSAAPLLDRRRFKVVTAELIHETNSFNKRRTELQHFKDRYYYQGEKAISERGDPNVCNTELSGFMHCQKLYNWEVVHVLSAAATASGIVTSETYEFFVNQITCAIEENKDSIDGVLLGLHGAMVVQGYDDGEGELLRRIRHILGTSIPIAITLDLHANVSAAMTDLADIVVSYKTYPHIDMQKCGIHAGSILQRTMLHEIDPVTIRTYVPLLEEANGGRTDVGAMIARVAKMEAVEASMSGALALSINAGFPTDIQGCDVGPTVLCTYDRRSLSSSSGACLQDHYQSIIDELAMDIWDKRTEVINRFLSVEEAVQIGVDFIESIFAEGEELMDEVQEGGKAGGKSGTIVSKGPLIIADYADNPGAGSYGDSTNILREMLLRRDVRNAVVAPMWDPQLADYVVSLKGYSAGDRIEEFIEIGGKMDSNHGGGPLRIAGAEVMLVSTTGAYVGTGPMIGGLSLSFGKTCVLRLDGRVDVLVVSEIEQLLDQSQLSSFGIDPKAKHIIALKSMQHFRAAFEPIAARVIVCDAGAIATPDVGKLHFEKVKRPVFPLDQDFEFSTLSSTSKSASAKDS